LGGFRSGWSELSSSNLSKPISAKANKVLVCLKRCIFTKEDSKEEKGLTYYNQSQYFIFHTKQQLGIQGDIMHSVILFSVNGKPVHDLDYLTKTYPVFIVLNRIHCTSQFFLACIFGYMGLILGFLTTQSVFVNR